MARPAGDPPTRPADPSFPTDHLRLPGLRHQLLYIGRSWVVHLRLFRLLRKYDHGLINRNLFFLFFIVVFPFTNAGLTHYDSGTFILPAIIYLANLALVGITHYLFCRYIIIEKPSLSVEGRKEEKLFIYTRGLYTMFVTGAMPIIAIALWLLFPARPVYVLYSFVLLTLGLRFVKRRLKRFDRRFRMKVRAFRAACPCLRQGPAGNLRFARSRRVGSPQCMALRCDP